MKNTWKKRTAISVMSATLLFGGVYTLTDASQENIGEEVSAASAVKFATTTYQTKDNLNLRAGASTKYKVLVSIPKGTKVTSAYRVGNWYKVSYKGKTGYVSGSYLTKVTAKAPATSTGKKYHTTSNLELHSGAAFKTSVLWKIPKGKSVEYLGKKGGWWKVKYGYLTGYVDAKHLKAGAPTVQKPAVTQKVMSRTQAEAHVSGIGKKYYANYIALVTQTGRHSVVLEFESEKGGKAHIILDSTDYRSAVEIQPQDFGQANYDATKAYLKEMDVAILKYIETQFGAGTADSKNLASHIKNHALKSSRGDVKKLTVQGKTVTISNDYGRVFLKY